MLCFKKLKQVGIIPCTTPFTSAHNLSILWLWTLRPVMKLPRFIPRDDIIYIIIIPHHNFRLHGLPARAMGAQIFGRRSGKILAKLLPCYCLCTASILAVNCARLIGSRTFNLSLIRHLWTCIFRLLKLPILTSPQHLE